MASVLLVLGAADGEIVEALGGALVLGSHQGHDALVDLDAGNDSALVEHLHEERAVGGLLVQGLLEQDDAGHVFGDFLKVKNSKSDGGGRRERKKGGAHGVRAEEQLPVVSAVGLGVFDVDVLESFSDSA